ncbi:MAG: cobyric acid synthase [Deltaproteobacteria bacterium]|nr:cobyric acid synthase [Deltaproteobacteria bacterium]
MAFSLKRHKELKSSPIYFQGRGSAGAVMFLGTGSDVGKSIVTTAFCRIFKRRGIRVAPFKAQNMSNNSFVTIEGGEIGRAQVVQAEAAGLLPSVHMNPILLKPATGHGSQIILQGKVLGRMEAFDYHKYKPRLRKVVMESYNRLAGEYDLIVMEGAGSCCEMNLKENDLVNFSMAKAVNAPCILVADIDRGGVFAQIIGSFHLMTRKEKDLTIGFIINKFRGDPRLFSSGIDYIEKKTGRPVLGLIPYFQDIKIDSEDSVAVEEDKRPIKPAGPGSINIAVLRLPAISNFTDLEGLEREPDLVVNYLFQPEQFSGEYDFLIIPGTKNVIEDAIWVARSGWKKVIRSFVHRAGKVLGICGGYQLLGRSIMDPGGMESNLKEIKGLGLLPVETCLEEKKTVRKVTGRCLINGKRVAGYEIHMGKTNILSKRGEPFAMIHEPGKKRSWNDGCCVDGGQISGTYIHGILDSPGFRADLLNHFRKNKGLKLRESKYGRLARFHQYDRLADHFESHCDVNRILSYLE